MTRHRVAVVGAGAAGISAGFRLRAAGAEVTVLEAGDRVGGRCATTERAGFRFDLGAGALPTTYTATLDLIDALGLRDEVELRGAVIGALRDGRVHRIARRDPRTFLAARHLSVRDKASLWRLGADLARAFPRLGFTDLGTAAPLDRETVHDYTARAFPEAVRTDLLEPVTRALLLVEPERTSVVDLFAACRALLLGGHLITQPDGVGFFLGRAARLLDVRCSTPVTEVVEDRDGVVVRRGDGRPDERFDAAVLAVPAHTTAALHPGLDAARRRFLESLSYSESLVVALGVARAPAGETSSMVLVPRDVHPDLAVVGLGHNLAPGRAPTGGGVLTCYWMSDWSAAHRDATDDELVALTRTALEGLLPGWAADVRAHAVGRWSPALVASEVGTYRDLAAFHAADDPGSRIRLAGDYHAQTSVEASVAAGARAAREVGTLLDGLPSGAGVPSTA